MHHLYQINNYQTHYLSSRQSRSSSVGRNSVVGHSEKTALENERLKEEFLLTYIKSTKGPTSLVTFDD